MFDIRHHIVCNKSTALRWFLNKTSQKEYDKTTILITHKSINQYRKPDQLINYCKYAVTIMCVFRKLKPARKGIISLLLFCFERGEWKGRVCVLRSILLKENVIRCSQEVNLHAASSQSFSTPQPALRTRTKPKLDAFITSHIAVSLMI